MQSGANDYLKRKAQQLNLGRAEALDAATEMLNGLYPGQIRVMSLNDGVLKIMTPSAAVASEIRLRQVELIGKLQTYAEVTKLQIQIGSLS